MNKLRILSILSVVSILSCSGFAAYSPFYSEVKEFEQTYMQRVSNFDSTYDVRVYNTVITFSFNLPGRMIGYCNMDDSRSIVINYTFWKNASAISKKNLIFHELGHCIFNREHTEDRYVDDCPKSLMGRVLLSDACYEAHQLDLINELPGKIR